MATTVNIPQWGQLFDSFVDAALYTEPESVARDEVLAHVQGETLVPGRYLYSSDSCAANWIRLTRDPKYKHHRETVEFWANSGGKEISALVHEQLECDEIDYVSLGPGAGEKDAALIGRWLDSGIDVFYYPYDISMVLVATAIRKVRENIPRNASQRLRIKAALADFHHLQAMKEVFTYRDSPKVLSLLGSLGNLEQDLAFLRHVKSEMSRRDILILEVRLDSGKERPSELMKDDTALRFDFGPIENYLGVGFDRRAMIVHNEREVSAVDNTVTTVVGCNSVEYNGTDYKNIRLIYIHQYSESEFLKALTKVGFEILYSKPGGKSERFLVCVVRKKH
jgi:hypothetical protein